MSADSSSDVGTKQWLLLLELTTNYMLAAEALIEALQGNLGISTASGITEEVVLEVARRVDEYQAARKSLVAYARTMEAVMG